MPNDLDLTVIIKTFERPTAVHRLYDSIRLYYPELPVIVADDSRQPISSLGDAKIIHLPFNVGLSKGRNAMISQVDTKYFLLLDDDFFFTESTDLSIPYKILEEDSFDIVGIELKDFGWKNRINRGVYTLENNILWLNQLAHGGLINGHPKYDFILNCFMAKTVIAKENPWDEILKIGHEHDDFFLRLKSKNIKITHTTKSIIEHYPELAGEYKNIRENTDPYKKMFFKKHNLVKVSQRGRNYPYWQRKSDTLLKYLKMLKLVNTIIYRRHLKKAGLHHHHYR